MAIVSLRIEIHLNANSCAPYCTSFNITTIRTILISLTPPPKPSITILQAFTLNAMKEKSLYPILFGEIQVHTSLNAFPIPPAMFMRITPILFGTYNTIYNKSQMIP
jgi:hypothetical protein